MPLDKFFEQNFVIPKHSTMFTDNYKDYKMTPEKIVKYYNAGTLGSFSTALFELFFKADSHNQMKLGEAFPEYFEAYILYMRG
jgi:hypothetical protein